jgi:uncharacterized protein
MNVADELQKLQQLRQSGAISDEEYTRAKANLLSAPPPSGQGAPIAPVDTEQQTRQWAMFLHLSQLANFLLPLGGLIVPIVIWQIKKTELPGIDVHGKMVVNWIISELIYFFVSFILLFVLVGFLLLPALAVLAIVFPIIGGVKASNGEVWKYPLSIPFFK